jgi:hypothetical protein
MTTYLIAEGYKRWVLSAQLLGEPVYLSHFPTCLAALSIRSFTISYLMEAKLVAIRSTSLNNGRITYFPALVFLPKFYRLSTNPQLRINVRLYDGCFHQP